MGFCLLTFYFCWDNCQRNNGYYELTEDEKRGGGQMTKAELVENMAKDAKISKAAAGAALDFFYGQCHKCVKEKRQLEPITGSVPWHIL
jgi:hypothetical protein